jgi:hypothetical protein
MNTITETLNYSIKVNHQLKFIEHKHIGVIERKDLADVWAVLLKMNEFTNEGYNLLSDYSDGTFSFGHNDLEPIDSFLETVRDIIKGKKNAVIVEKPNDYVLSILVGEDLLSRMNYFVKLFSTRDSAIEFLS